MKLRQQNDNKQNLVESQLIVGVRPCERLQVAKSTLVRITRTKGRSGRGGGLLQKENWMAEYCT